MKQIFLCRHCKMSNWKKSDKNRCIRCGLINQCPNCNNKNPKFCSDKRRDVSEDFGETYWLYQHYYLECEKCGYEIEIGSRCLDNKNDYSMILTTA